MSQAISDSKLSLPVEKKLESELIAFKVISVVFFAFGAIAAVGGLLNLCFGSLTGRVGWITFGAGMGTALVSFIAFAILESRGDKEGEKKRSVEAQEFFTTLRTENQTLSQVEDKLIRKIWEENPRLFSQVVDLETSNTALHVLFSKPWFKEVPCFALPQWSPAKEIVKNEFPTWLCAPNKNGDTPLHLLARQKDPYLMTRHVQQVGNTEAFTRKDKEGNTPLHLVFQSFAQRKDGSVGLDAFDRHFVKNIRSCWDQVKELKNNKGQTPLDCLPGDLRSHVIKELMAK